MSDAPVTGNKVELAAALGVSLPTLSAWMIKWPDFPILSRGSNGRSYEFDFAAVFAFLRQKREEQSASKAARDEALAQLKLPFDIGQPEQRPASATVADEIKALQLRRLQREEAEKSRQLVPIAEVAPAIAATLTRLSRDAHAFLRQLAREQSWPESYLSNVIARFSDQQRAAVRDLQAEFTADEPEPARAYG